VVLHPRSPTGTFRQNWRKVLAFDEAILLDSALDPVAEITTYAEKGVQVAGITELLSSPLKTGMSWVVLFMCSP